MKRKRAFDRRATALVARMDALVRRFMHTQRGAALEEDLPLSRREFRVLEAMEAQPAFRMGELAGRVMLTLSGLTAVVDGLVEKKLVARARLEADRRVVEVCLTDAGRRLGGQCRRRRLRMARALLAPLAENEQELFLELLGRSADGAAPVRKGGRS